MMSLISQNHFLHFHTLQDPALPLKSGTQARAKSLCITALLARWAGLMEGCPPGQALLSISEHEVWDRQNVWCIYFH